MTHMQQSFDERMGVMKNLIDQTTDETGQAASAEQHRVRQLRHPQALLLGVREMQQDVI